MVLTETYKNKIESCKQSIKLMGVEISDILSNYDGEVFPDSQIDKRKLISNVLNLSIDAEDEAYLTDKCGMSRFRDVRTPAEYGIDLILGWLFEDSVLHFLKANDKVAILSGNDRYREFLTARQISTQPDIILSIEGSDEKRNLEIMCDWKDTWKKKGHCDLRDSKFIKLVNEKALMFGFAPNSQSGFLMDFTKSNYEFEESIIPAFMKKGYTTNTVRNYIKPLNDIKEDLFKILNNN